MATTVQLRSVETFHSDATVCDFDELPDAAKDSIASVAKSDDTEATISLDASPTFNEYDIIKYTGYYHIETE